MEFKYVIVDSLGLETPIFGPDWLGHSDLFNPNTAVAIRAGFCKIGKDFVSVWGKSHTLGLASDPIDADLIREMMDKMKE